VVPYDGASLAQVAGAIEVPRGAIVADVHPLG
jgi:hypothetical protein